MKWPYIGRAVSVLPSECTFLDCGLHGICSFPFIRLHAVRLELWTVTQSWMSGSSFFWKTVIFSYCLSKKVENPGFMICLRIEEQRVNAGKLFPDPFKQLPFLIFPSELWDFELYFKKRYQRRLFFVSNFELNDPYFIETVASNLMKNQTFERCTWSCRFVRKRRN
jgi:hypothetical protein